MPANLHTPISRLSQKEFGDLAYSVMRCVFEIHHELGRFFDEKIYKQELARRYPGVQLEVPIALTHSTFQKTLYLDVLVKGGGVFEFKTVEAIIPRHSSQLLQYLLLADLSHGKLVNLRKESVEHEFVNTTLRLKDRVEFETAEVRWSDKIEGAERFRAVLTSVLRDWGTGLDLQLYDEAITHLLGGEEKVVANVGVCSSGQLLGRQRIKVASPLVGFVLTALPDVDPDYESHTLRLLRHMELEAILWANISLKRVTFTAIT